MKASLKMQKKTFIEAGICHQTASLRTLHSDILIVIFKCKLYRQRMPRQVCPQLARASPRCCFSSRRTAFRIRRKRICARKRRAGTISNRIASLVCGLRKSNNIFFNWNVVFLSNAARLRGDQDGTACGCWSLSSGVSTLAAVTLVS